MKIFVITQNDCPVMVMQSTEDDAMEKAAEMKRDNYETQGIWATPTDGSLLNRQRVELAVMHMAGHIADLKQVSQEDIFIGVMKFINTGEEFGGAKL